MWNNLVRYLTSHNAARMIQTDLEFELRALDQARFTTDGRHFDSLEGEAWMDRERIHELEGIYSTLSSKNGE